MLASVLFTLLCISPPWLPSTKRDVEKAYGIMKSTETIA